MGDTGTYDAGNCTDISKEMPSTDSDILYTRLFGHGEHNLYQFDDAELLDIESKIVERNIKKAYLTFHGARMYNDATRLKIYQKSGTFPNVTKTTGLGSKIQIRVNPSNYQKKSMHEAYPIPCKLRFQFIRIISVHFVLMNTI